MAITIQLHVLYGFRRSKGISCLKQLQVQSSHFQRLKEISNKLGCWMHIEELKWQQKSHKLAYKRGRNNAFSIRKLKQAIQKIQLSFFLILTGTPRIAHQLSDKKLLSSMRISSTIQITRIFPLLNGEEKVKFKGGRLIRKTSYGDRNKTYFLSNGA